MDAFVYRDGELCAESVPFTDLAERFGTPTYIYSRGAIESRLAEYGSALARLNHLVCYAVKANSNLAVLDIVRGHGAGFDIVSGGELARVQVAGGDMRKVVFAGVGKTEDEIRAALEAGIRSFNVESESELHRLQGVAADMNRVAPVTLRVNPDVDPKTHPYIATGLKESKFGIPIGEAARLVRAVNAATNLDLVGVGAHIGSQLTSLGPIREAVAELVVLYDAIKPECPALRHIDVGGGLGVRYQDEVPPSVADYAEVLNTAIAHRDVELVLEPGRSLVAGAGALLARVEVLKGQGEKHFAIVDAGMNDLLRPALYQSWQRVLPVRDTGTAEQSVDIVGPVCESGDWLARDRRLRLQERDLVAILDVGAYGFVMASNYNSRPRPAEVMVDGESAFVVRERESQADLWRGENRLPG